MYSLMTNPWWPPPPPPKKSCYPVLLNPLILYCKMLSIRVLLKGKKDCFGDNIVFVKWYMKYFIYWTVDLKSSYDDHSLLNNIFYLFVLFHVVGTFNFQCTLHRNGTIWFAYKQVCKIKFFNVVYRESHTGIWNH